MIRSVPVVPVLLALAATTLASGPAHAQKKVTAGEVVDRETPRDFVLWAESVFAAVEDINEGAQLLQEVRTEGSDYNVGNVYVILFTTEGQVLSTVRTRTSSSSLPRRTCSSTVPIPGGRAASGRTWST